MISCSLKFAPRDVTKKMRSLVTDESQHARHPSCVEIFRLSFATSFESIKAKAKKLQGEKHVICDSFRMDRLKILTFVSQLEVKARKVAKFCNQRKTQHTKRVVPELFWPVQSSGPQQKFD